MDGARSLIFLKKIARQTMDKEDNIKVTMNEEVFGYSCTIYIARDDVLHFCDMDMIPSSCISAYIG